MPTTRDEAAAQLAESERTVIDGGLAWSATVQQLTLYDGDGATLAEVQLWGDYELDDARAQRIALAIGEVMGVIKLE